jgi:monoamine oxidase
MGTAESQAQMVLPWIELVYPGSAAKYVPNSAIRQHWPTYPHTKGSYASYKLGQWSFFGLEGAREENQHFCGEHCSEDFQGYMEGGAETGAMVAAEILDDLGVAQPPVLAGILSMLVARPRGSYHAGFGERMHPSQIRQR